MGEGECRGHPEICGEEKYLHGCSVLEIQSHLRLAQPHFYHFLSPLFFFFFFLFSLSELLLGPCHQIALVAVDMADELDH